MKPTTEFTLAMRLPGQSAKTHEALCNKSFASQDKGDGNLMIHPCDLLTAVKAIATMLSVINLTKTMSIGICRSEIDAMNFFKARAAGSQGTLSESSVDWDSMMEGILAEQLATVQPDELIYLNPDVTEAEWAEATASKEYQDAYRYRHMDMRATLPTDDLNRIWKTYADKFPKVAAHDPKWAD